MKDTIYQFSATSISGEIVNLEKYRNQVMLIVNTASACGFTKQYSGLEALYQQFKAEEFAVLGFPCNQFGAQEPASNEKIAEFCQLNYALSFDLFAKIEVNGGDAEPLFTFLKQRATGLLGSQNIKWNFTKFLVDQQGTVLKRYAPATKPEAIAEDIASLFD
ncbi:MAG: glutathione peroxidase [Osedax symbiont Rs1]|nr:MAG: glutathione peroxidase [Osedax symbiont Rs1]